MDAQGNGACVSDKPVIGERIEPRVEDREAQLLAVLELHDTWVFGPDLHLCCQGQDSPFGTADEIGFVVAGDQDRYA